MNLNEKCLLDYLHNPEELVTLTAVLEENLRLLAEDSKVFVPAPLGV